MCSKPCPSDLCSSTFPNFVSQIVKIGYPHIFYEDKRPHGGHDCAGKTRTTNNDAQPLVAFSEM